MSEVIRPSEWWRQRAWEQPVQPVAIRFAPDLASSGWIDLHLDVGEQALRIAMSEVYDPLPAMLDWLQAIAEGDLPVAFDINDECLRWRLRAHQGHGDSVLLVIGDVWNEQVQLAERIDRQALVEAFRGAVLVLIDELRRLPRDSAPWDPRGGHLEAYFDGLHEHALWAH